MKARNFVLNREAKSQTLSKASVQSVVDVREPWQADVNSLNCPYAVLHVGDRTLQLHFVIIISQSSKRHPVSTLMFCSRLDFNLVNSTAILSQSNFFMSSKLLNSTFCHGKRNSIIHKVVWRHCMWKPKIPISVCNEFIPDNGSNFVTTDHEDIAKTVSMCFIPHSV